MKKITNFIFISFLVVLFTGCQKEPSVSFTVDKTDAYTGETITFTNTSLDAVTYHWEFGDGETSDVMSPTHVYQDEGVYIVKLTAYSKNGKKSAMATKEIKITQANAIIYQGNQYLIEGVGITNIEQHFFGIALLDKDALYQDQGNFVLIGAASSSSTSVTDGLYTFQETGKPYTIYFASLNLNYNLHTNTGMMYDAVNAVMTFE